MTQNVTPARSGTTPQRHGGGEYVATAGGSGAADQLPYGQPSLTFGRRALRVVLPILVLAAAVALGAGLMMTPPQVPKTQPPPMAAVVSIAPLEPVSVPIFVDVFGTVTAARRLDVQPQIEGRVVELHPQLLPGGLVQKGELLFRIEPADYEIAVAEAQGNLDAARNQAERLRAGLGVLEARAEQLSVEIEYLRWNAARLGRLSEQESAAQTEARDAETRLASQLAALRAIRAQIVEQHSSIEGAEAQVRVAKARLESANIELKRTIVTVPFDAVVLTENVELSQLVSPGTTVATLAATDEFWVQAAVPIAKFPFIRFAEDDPAQASSATMRLATGEHDGLTREGVALRPLSELDPQGRMTRVLISVRNPMQPHGDGASPQAALFLGSYVRVSMDAGVLRDVYVIPRSALRENDRVWVRDADGALAIRPVSIVWRRQDDVLARNGFLSGDTLVTSHLASVVPGMPLRVLSHSDEGEEAAAAGAGINTLGTVDRKRKVHHATPSS